jgi:hypothetical protein
MIEEQKVMQHSHNKEIVMRHAVLLAFVSAVLTGPVVAQEPNEHLKGFASFIGTWRHEGPVPEDIPGIAAKGSKAVLQASWTWILDKQVVMCDFFIEFEGGPKSSGKVLIGWNAAEKKIMGGGMDSDGGMDISTHVIDGKTLTSTGEGVDRDGRKTSSKVVHKKIDEDTLEWQMLELRTGENVTGPGPVATFKRIK